MNPFPGLPITRGMLAFLDFFVTYATCPFSDALEELISWSEELVSVVLPSCSLFTSIMLGLTS